MMQPANARQIDYLAFYDRPALNTAAIGRILFKAQMCSVAVVIFEIQRQNGFQVTRIQYDDMVCTFSPDRADYSFNKRILPRFSRGREYFFNAHVLHSITKENAIDRIPIPHQILWRRIPREGLHDLLGCPLGRGI